MKPQAIQSPRQSIGALIALAATAALAGCHAEPPPAVIARPVAPRATESMADEALPQVRFVDVTKESGITFTHANFALGDKLLPETMGSGVAVLDYDSDGDPDLFFVNSGPWPGQSPAEGGTVPVQGLFRNDGKGRFEDVTQGSGLDVSLPGMGAAVGDYDNDGDPDLYITALGGGRLFRNDAGKFVDVTTQTKTQAARGWLTSAAFFDMENDGDLDLFICQYVVWSPEIDRGITTQITGDQKKLAYDPPSAFKGTSNILLRNDGGTFADISQEAGIDIRTPDLKEPMAKSLGVAPFDIDGDGLVDLAVANDTVPNFLYHNQGNGKFEEVGIICGVALDKSGSARGAMGIDWADFKGDGSLALAIGNFANEMIALYVVDDPTTLQFADLANLYGLGAPTQPPLKFGLFFFDYDLDGRPDLLSVNGHLESDISLVQASQTYPQSAQLYWNASRPRQPAGGSSGPSAAARGDSRVFVQIGPSVAGPDLFKPIVGRGSAYADFDGDGDLDVVLTANGGPAMLCRNDGGSQNHWLRLKLAGARSNRDAIGARVQLEADGKTIRQQLFPAKGYLSSAEPMLTFGLGSASKVDRVAIIWPSGAKSDLKDVNADQVLSVSEPK